MPLLLGRSSVGVLLSPRLPRRFGFDPAKAPAYEPSQKPVHDPQEDERVLLSPGQISKNDVADGNHTTSHTDIKPPKYPSANVKCVGAGLAPSGPENWLHRSFLLWLY